MRNDMWKDPTTGKVSQFKVGGTKALPAYRDEDMYDKPQPLRNIRGGGGGAEWLDEFTSPPEVSATPNPYMADSATPNPYMEDTRRDIQAQWDRAEEGEAIAPIPEHLRGLAPGDMLSRTLGRRPAPGSPMAPQPRRAGATPRGTRRVTSATARSEQGNRESRDRISRLMESLRVGR